MLSGQDPVGEGREIPNPEGTGLRSGFVAIVNGQVITRYELDKELRPAIMGYPPDALRRDLPKIRRQILDQIIVNRLLIQRCDEEGIEARDEQVAAWLQEEIRRFSQGGAPIKTEDDYYQILQDEREITPDEAREYVRDQVRVLILYYRRVFKDEFVPPRELRAFYDAHSDQFSTNSVHKFRRIFVPIGDPYLKETLEAIDKGIADGVAFEELVEKHSQGPRADIGGFYERTDKQVNDWPGGLPKAIRGLKPGETSGKIANSQGVHYIHMEDRVEGEKLSFADAQDQIRKRIAQERRRMQLERFWNELKRKAIIEIFLDEAPAPPTPPAGG